MDRQLSETIFYVYIIPVVCIPDIIGNILNLITLRRKSLNDSPYTYLTALAVVELVLLISMIGNAFLRCEPCEPNSQEEYVTNVYKYLISVPIANVAHFSANFITLAMTVERYIFVRFSLYAKNLCTKKNARIAIIFVVIISIIINIPSFFMFTVHTPFTNTAAIFSPRFLVMECSFPFNNSNTKTNVTYLIPRCILSRLSSVNSSAHSLDLIMRERLVENGFHIVDSLETRWEYSGNPLIPFNDVAIGKCVDVFDSNNVDEDKFFPLVNWTELNQSQNLKIESFRFFIIDNSTRINLFKNFSLGVASLSNSSFLNRDSAPRSTNSSSFVFLQYYISKYPSTLEIRLLVNISNNDELAKITKNVSCFQDYQTTSYSWPSSNIIYNSSALIVRITSFHVSYNEIIYYVQCAFELSITFVTGVLNLILIKLLYQSIKNRQKLLATDNFEAKIKDLQTQHRLTLTLVVASSFAVFSSCFTVFAIDPVAEVFFGDNFRKNETYLWMLLINNTLTMINNSINFVLYALINTRFRSEFLLAIAAIIFPFRCCFKWLKSTLRPHKNIESSRFSLNANVVSDSGFSIHL